MRKPHIDFRNKISLDTTKEFYDKEYGWVVRLDDPCPNCRREKVIVTLSGFRGCTHCLFAEPLEGRGFIEGGYTKARMILETINKQTRCEKPVQPRFHPMYMKRRG